MFVTTIKIATTIILIALTSDAGNEDEKLTETTTTMFPGGLTHDFGKLRSGTQARRV